MPEEKNIEYVELLEKSLLIIHQKQDYQQQIINNPAHPLKETILNRIDELQKEVEEVFAKME